MTSYDNPNGYAVALDATADTSSGDTHEVTINAYEHESYDRNDEPTYAPSRQIGDSVSTGVAFGEDDSLVKAMAAADRVLTEQGWERTEDWRVEDDAVWADVQRS